MINILSEIILVKRREIEILKEKSAYRIFEKSRFFSRETLSLSESICDRKRTGIIAEFKRRSPSGGILNKDANVEVITEGYSGSGASGLSILTDNHFFGGSCRDIELVRDHVSIPILRKDFIIDEIQVLESKASGADAVLLIAALLDREEILNLSRLTRSLGMEVLLEVHSERELDSVNKYVSIIGVNNRDLDTLTTDTRLSEYLAEKMPSDILRISESGISDPQTVVSLRNAGYSGFLIGEYFMKKPDPVIAFKEFVKKIGK